MLELLGSQWSSIIQVSNVDGLLLFLRRSFYPAFGLRGGENEILENMIQAYQYTYITY